MADFRNRWCQTELTCRRARRSLWSWLALPGQATEDIQEQDTVCCRQGTPRLRLITLNPDGTDKNWYSFLSVTKCIWKFKATLALETQDKTRPFLSFFYTLLPKICWCGLNKNKTKYYFETNHCPTDSSSNLELAVTSNTS